jgi:hypothetical protein
MGEIAEEPDPGQSEAASTAPNAGDKNIDNNQSLDVLEAVQLEIADQIGSQHSMAGGGRTVGNMGSLLGGPLITPPLLDAWDPIPDVLSSNGRHLQEVCNCVSV